MRRFGWLSCVLALVSFGAACGDDSGSGDGGPDGGVIVVDSGTDGPRMDAPVMDGATDAGVELPLTECDPFTKGSCGDGEKCQLAIYDPDNTVEMNEVVFWGCVPTTIGNKAEGILCDRYVELPAGSATEELGSNECAQGLFCWSTLDDTFERCRPICGGETAVECESTSEFCLTINSEPPFGICNPTSGCDPVYQTGCDTDEGCYVVRAGADDVASRCFEHGAPDGGTSPGPGMPCMFVNDCVPGSQCNGRITDGMVDMEALCRAFCPAGAGMLDGGPGAVDGGTLAFTCGSGETCERLIIPDGGAYRVPTIPGQCQ
jgi:hypothetical protein